MIKFFNKVKTYYALGFSNLFWVATYRIMQKRRYFVKALPIKPIVTSVNHADIFFTTPACPSSSEPLSIKTPPLTAFGWLPINQNTAPNWLQSIDNKKEIENNNIHWSAMNDFDLTIGDVKAVWELSRLDWLLNFALQYKATNDITHIEKMNSWLTSWSFTNPVNQGVNWKCGQEASIRVMHLTLALLLLEQQKKTTPVINSLIFSHLQRIAPTLHYAMAQDNNHGTSEAAALYIGATLLLQNKDTDNQKLLLQWQKQGRYWLENRTKYLIDSDGTFSQYSVNYHRLMLDTISLAEYVRRLFDEKSFNKCFYKKAELATHWLFNFVEPSTGEAPNMGLNDGANLLPITLCGYRDYRPSVQFASALFLQCYAYPVSGIYHQICQLLPVSIKTSSSLLTSNIEINQGFQIIKQHNWRIFLRTPTAKFRPGCCDALHADLWLGKLNLLKGTGSYSYNCDKKWQDYFVSVNSHNTVSFDDKEQMPRISRFLYSNWLNTKVEKINAHSLTASYRNKVGHQHKRQLSIIDDTIIIEDTISGFNSNAKLHWHLAELNWQLEKNTLTAENITITISTSTKDEAIVRLVEGAESRYYLKKNALSVLQVTMVKPGTITTTIKHSS